MPQLRDLPLDGVYPATCQCCGGRVLVSVTAVHEGTDYSGEIPVHQASMRGTYTHTCTPPEGART